MTELIIDWMITIGLFGAALALIAGAIGAIWQAITNRRDK